MKPLILLIHTLLFSVVPMLTPSLSAQSVTQARPLGLVRLNNEGKVNDASRIAGNNFTVDDLSEAGFGEASHTRKNGIECLSLDAGRYWVRPLRASRRPAVSVSFLVLGSQSTIVEVGGARLGLTASLADGSLQLMYDATSEAGPEWRSLGIYLPLEKYDGRLLGAAPLLTVQIEPETNVWHLFAGTRLLAYGLPLLPDAEAKITVKSGTEGALICGLVQSDENPLFVDSNGNGIDDDFEKKTHGGSLLPSNAALQQRSAVIQAWKAAQKNKPATALSYARLSPD
jgi:hypothetical protein